MRVTVNFAGDVKVPGGKLAVHVGQAYDLPDDIARKLVKGGSAYRGEPKPAKEAPAPRKEPGVTPDEKEADPTPENKGAGATEKKD